MRGLCTLVLLSTVLVGCGQPFEVRTIGRVDYDFKEYVKRFGEATGIQVIYVDIYYNELDGNVIGRCRIKGQQKDVEIDPDWWSRASDSNREILMFHELAHCVLLQGHRNYELDDGCPGSIMDTYHIGEYCYERHRDYYVDEMIKGGQSGELISDDHTSGMSCTH